MSVIRRKLIEVALPLETINRESAREKSIRHGHPSTLHLWWARRPLAAARAVLFAQLVDDPSSHPDRFPTEEDQASERQRLFRIIEELVDWNNVDNHALMAQARHEILASTGGQVPAIVDPFAGGGSIPLEAQRLGLDAYASDLNPVAVLINKALVEIPPQWSEAPPVFPGAAQEKAFWPRAAGMAEDVRRYGDWVRDQALERVGGNYPEVTLEGGSKTWPMAWLWARTIVCPNPACNAELPLLSTHWLSKKKARPTWLEPIVTDGRVQYEVRVGKGSPGEPSKRGQGATFVCPVCGSVADRDYVHEEFTQGRDGQRLLATVTVQGRQRVYLEATEEQAAAAAMARPEDAPDQESRGTFGGNAQGRRYGFRTYADYFTNRQLTTLCSLSELVDEARVVIARDAFRSGLTQEASSLYASHVCLYLAFAVSRTADRSSAMCSWDSSPKMESLRNTFARQAIAMAWDFAEGNPFSNSSGNFLDNVGFAAKVLERLPAGGSAFVAQGTADQVALPSRAVISTDPPYYDNIGYADLSDFFYVWLRRSLKGMYPDLTATMLTPKAEELVANPYRFDGSRSEANAHFESGFVRTFTRLREHAAGDVPMTVYYAFKQAESDDEGTASTGWETMLNALMAAKWTITATWPMRTELGNRMVGSGTNALASSIVLACRPRHVSADAASRRGFLTSLRDELPVALKRLQQGSIAPVDLAQAAIGPGMAIFSRYSRVAEADGSDMTVRTALALINQVLDEVLQEQEGDFDAETRFCVKWFTQFGWNAGASGEADVLSRAMNTSLSVLERGGVFRAAAGKARLLEPGEMTPEWNPAEDKEISIWEVAVRVSHALQVHGAGVAAELTSGAASRVDVDAVKELAYLMYSICDKRGWTESAVLFNGLGTSWSDLAASARSPREVTVLQGELDLDGDQQRTGIDGDGS